MSNGKLILFILLFLLLGLLLYKVKPRDFTDNTKFILNILFDELNNIYYNLRNKKISEFEKQSLLKRKDEIFKILEQFFGKNLKLQENELLQ